MYLNYLFYLHILKFYPIRLSFIYFVNSNLNPGEHPKAPMTTTHKSPNIAPPKFHVSLWRPSILQKILWLIWVISLHQSVCQVPKNASRVALCSWCCPRERSQAICWGCWMPCLPAPLCQTGERFLGSMWLYSKCLFRGYQQNLKKWVSFRNSRVKALTSFQLNWPVCLSISLIRSYRFFSTLRIRIKPFDGKI